MTKLNHSISKIARFLNRSPAAVTYELNHNALVAHALAKKNRHNHGRCSSLTPKVSDFLNYHIGILKWSPETADRLLGIASKTIYNLIHHGLLKVKVSD